ncbi:MAG: hypothetical protein QM704_15005 [Anaeromyxobacteraceae bacterium]
MSLSRSILLPLSAALAVAACSSEPAKSGDQDCRGCHGASASGAPSDAAHTLHLAGGAFARPVACAECHTLPPGGQHQDGTVQVTFGAFASKGGRAPQFSGNSCSGVYCHGSSVVVWTRVDGSQTTCAGCHGDPPSTGGHPQVAAAYCVGCHAATVTSAGALVAGGTHHLDGSVDATAFSHPGSWLAGHQPAALSDAGAACKPCHGADLKGGTSGKSCWSCHPTGPPV